MNGLISKIARAVLVGILIGFITALLLYLIDRAAGMAIAYQLWGLIVGVLAAIIVFFSGSMAI